MDPAGKSMSQLNRKPLQRIFVIFPKLIICYTWINLFIIPTLLFMTLNMFLPIGKNMQKKTELCRVSSGP